MWRVSPWAAARRRPLLARFLFYGVAVFVGLPLAFSQVLIGTVRQPVGPPRPGWEEIHFDSEGLRLRAWLAAGHPDRAAVVLVHGLGDSLEGYLGVARHLADRGHSVLGLDLRGHGGSEGRYTTLGGREREDVRAALRQVRERGLAGRGFVLMGWSMGAVAALRAAAEEADVRAVVAEAPFDTYRETTARHARLFYHVPGWLPLVPITVAFAEWRAGFDADEVDAVAAARSTRAPLLAIVDGADPRMPEATVRRVWDAHPGPKRLWVAPEADHVGARLRPEYWPEVEGFLGANGL